MYKMVYKSSINKKIITIIIIIIIKPVQVSKPPNLRAGRFAGLVNPVLVCTDLVRIKRSGLVNQFKIGANRTGP